MNLELLKESFCENYPEVPDGVIDSVSLAGTIQFNKFGTLLAVGCIDGRLIFWDFMTRCMVKIIVAHVHPIQSLSWSRNGHKILTSSTDHTVKIYDVVSGDCEYVYRFPSAVLRAQFHPRNPKILLVNPFGHAAVLVNTDGNHKIPIPLEDERDFNIVTSFDRRGDHVYTGNSKGKISIYSVPDFFLVASFKTGGGLCSAAVKSVEFAPRGDCFLLNSADRIIRVYKCEDVLRAGIEGNPEPISKIQDLVGKTAWKKCCFSGDGEYVCAASAKQHQLKIWDKGMGNLVKIFHGNKGVQLIDVVWHPLRPIVASISGGVVSIWAQRAVENWSAFQPNFKELDENVEYEEKESEFDVEDEDKEKFERKKEDAVDDDELEVDVTTCEPIGGYVCSDDEEGDEKDYLMFIPIAPDVIPDVDENLVAKQEAAAGTKGHQRRKKSSKCVHK
ncbi:unnamed protein product [Orchesella dallaii]|uniref:Retinoblastoma-binding protein 5 n=1 Tax=Orchesella dallaii TaxID=48710 RepID=A0ABP1S8M4_9HEXA